MTDSGLNAIVQDYPFTAAVLDGHERWAIIDEDCVTFMAKLPEASIDSIVADPPYGIEFMGKNFDKLGDGPGQQAWHMRWAREALRVLKPGSYIVASSSPRTYHRLACALEDAGFEIRDSLMYVYGSGMPKSRNISLSIDKGDGHPNRGRAVPTASTHLPNGRYAKEKLTSNPVGPYAPKSERSAAWQGFGTNLKPAYEPICMARKPLEGNIAANVLRHGTGGINIDACRIAASPADFAKLAAGVESIRARGGVMKGSWKNSSDLSGANPANPLGRWPANVLLSHLASCVLTGEPNNEPNDELCAEDCPVAELNRQSGAIKASRFFYTSKPPRSEKDAGVPDGNKHVTVKPIKLMRYLCKLITPPGGVVLDPFAGSGTTGCAALLEGFRFIGIEKEQEYADIACTRITHWAQQESY